MLSTAPTVFVIKKNAKIRKVFPTGEILNKCKAEKPLIKALVFVLSLRRHISNIQFCLFRCTPLRVYEARLVALLVPVMSHNLETTSDRSDKFAN